MGCEYIPRSSVFSYQAAAEQMVTHSLNHLPRRTTTSFFVVSKHLSDIQLMAARTFGNECGIDGSQSAGQPPC